MAFRPELLIVQRDDAGGFLASMLERVQAKGRQGTRIFMAEYTEYAALFLELVRIDIKRLCGIGLAVHGGAP